MALPEKFLANGASQKLAKDFVKEKIALNLAGLFTFFGTIKEIKYMCVCIEFIHYCSLLIHPLLLEYHFKCAAEKLGAKVSIHDGSLPAMHSQCADSVLVPMGTSDAKRRCQPRGHCPGNISAKRAKEWQEEEEEEEGDDTMINTDTESNTSTSTGTNTNTNTAGRTNPGIPSHFALLPSQIRLPASGVWKRKQYVHANVNPQSAVVSQTGGDTLVLNSDQLIPIDISIFLKFFVCLFVCFPVIIYNPSPRAQKRKKCNIVQLCRFTIAIIDSSFYYFF
ncbi:hypothetical protein RFI_11986 [Reticulomyxa filosa]|uniref:Uncharacterized protein n=1 Tax=Reticulomyxa filosa TaxID=46433 RepID=X6NFR1_RETFI|nr:hypothetical protein RFI_11986 [Reticulomyxa filosa]|eukprot:ETO25160.1 hypothetical protein RFI_11986 [Reticulomyxa filosa]